MANQTGRQWGVATQSGTDALSVALKVLAIEPGDRVAIPSYMCSAPLDAIALAGGVPVAIDIDRQTLSIDPQKLNSAANIKAVVVPHLFGIPARIQETDHPNVIEDCAQTLGMDYDNRKIGSFGKLSICSFYGTKLLTTGHGGMILGDDCVNENRVVDLLSHDNRESWEPHFHFLMSDLNASLGLSQLEKLSGFVRERKRIAGIYMDALTGTDSIANSIFSRFLVAAQNADQTIAYFRERGIEAKRPVYKPISMLLEMDGKNFPNAMWAHEHIVSIPIYPGLPDDHIAQISGALKSKKSELKCWPQL